MRPVAMCVGAGLLLTLVGILMAQWFVTQQQTQQPSLRPSFPVHDSDSLQSSAATSVPFLATSAMAGSSLGQQLRAVEAALPAVVVNRFAFQRSLRRNSPNDLRPHNVDYEKVHQHWGLPVGPPCPSPLRPDLFCVPNLGRDWDPKNTTVLPISYSLPLELYASVIPRKDQDCAAIVPRDRKTYRFTSEEEYRAEYARSYYCITYKKGGWDVLRHYEIIAAGCMPYFVDIDYAPLYTLYHFPKKEVLEARELPGVSFNCTSVQVHIDHSLFPRAKYFDLLQRVMDHARSHLSTKSMAKYFLSAAGVPNATKVLYLARATRGTPLRAQGNYNSWTLLHGLRTLLGAGAVDSHEIPFLYNQSDAFRRAVRHRLYGSGFGYAFRLSKIDVNRRNIVQRIGEKEFDLIVYADPFSMMSVHRHKLLYWEEVKRSYPPSRIAFLHVPDIPYPDPKTIGYNVQQLYKLGIVFQREIADCSYFVPHDTKSEMMKRCVWYHNKNCLDDVNVVDAIRTKRLTEYVWNIPLRT